MQPNQGVEQLFVSSTWESQVLLKYNMIAAKIVATISRPLCSHYATLPSSSKEPIPLASWQKQPHNECVLEEKASPPRIAGPPLSVTPSETCANRRETALIHVEYTMRRRHLTDRAAQLVNGGSRRAVFSRIRLPPYCSSCLPPPRWLISGCETSLKSVVNESITCILLSGTREIPMPNRLLPCLRLF